MATALGFAARGVKSVHSPGAAKQQAQPVLTDDGASPQREGQLKAGKSYQNKKPYLSGPPQKARPVMAPPQNIKIQQKDSSNQPAPINDNDMVQDDDMAGKPSIIVGAVDQISDYQEANVFTDGADYE